jgi:hypothetical protein
MFSVSVRCHAQGACGACSCVSFCICESMLVCVSVSAGACVCVCVCARVVVCEQVSRGDQDVCPSKAESLERRSLNDKSIAIMHVGKSDRSTKVPPIV